MYMYVSNTYTTIKWAHVNNTHTLLGYNYETAGACYNVSNMHTYLPFHCMGKTLKCFSSFTYQINCR